MSGRLDRGLKIRPMVLPDRFIDQDKPGVMYAEAGLDRAAIVATAMSALGVAETVSDTAPQRA